MYFRFADHFWRQKFARNRIDPYVMDRRLFHVSRCCLEPVQFGLFLTVDIGIALVAPCMGDDPRISVSVHQYHLGTCVGDNTAAGPGCVMIKALSTRRSEPRKLKVDQQIP
jgi:hypothetical protein